MSEVVWADEVGGGDFFSFGDSLSASWLVMIMSTLDLQCGQA